MSATVSQRGVPANTPNEERMPGVAALRSASVRVRGRLDEHVWARRVVQEDVERV